MTLQGICNGPSHQLRARQTGRPAQWIVRFDMLFRLSGDGFHAYLRTGISGPCCPPNVRVVASTADHEIAESILTPWRFATAWTSGQTLTWELLNAPSSRGGVIARVETSWQRDMLDIDRPKNVAMVGA